MNPAPVAAASASFKREVIQVTARIFQFVLIYCLLVCAGLLLAAACVWGGVMIVAGLRSLFGLMIGLGVIGLGVMVCIFLLKFLFSVNRTDRSGYREITAAEEPALVEMVHAIARQTGTDLPKHIYLSADVNASVFYDSSFRSMFFPVRKNLVIGLGLVNALNKGELRAVIAHEFGHFSQRSMKLGSFVYQVNRVIYNMLYDNEGYSGFLQQWAEISNYFAFFAGITVKIVQAIQWVLRLMYGYVNKGYMRLSREMEFHADAVAAAACGGNNLVSALEKLPLANACYDEVLSGSNNWLKEGRLTPNFYQAQTYLLGNTPQEEVQDQYTRVTYKDQWASHPPTAERTEKLEALQLDAAPETAPAWQFFADATGMQQQITRFVYEQAKVDTEGKHWLDEDSIRQRLLTERKAYRMPELYNGCFDFRMLSLPAGGVALTDLPMPPMDDEQASLIWRIRAGAQDKSILDAIANQEIDAEYFEFDGVRYHHTDAEEIASRLNKDIESWQENLRRFDEQFLQYTFRLATDTGNADAWLAAYNGLLAANENKRAFDEQVENVHTLLAPMHRPGDIAWETAQEINHHLKNILEPLLKKNIRELTDAGILPEGKYAAFIDNDAVYLAGETFAGESFGRLMEVMDDVLQDLHQCQFDALRQLLEQQAILISNQVRA